MKTNPNLEDNIGVPFVIRLKIMTGQKWKELEMFKFEILNTKIICHKGFYQQLTLCSNTYISKGDTMLGTKIIELKQMQSPCQAKTT